MNKTLNNLKAVLSELDKQVVGFAKIYGTIELVIDVNEHTFTTVLIGSLNGHTISGYPISTHGNTMTLFPDGKTLSQMKENPFVLNDFCKANKIY